MFGSDILFLSGAFVDKLTFTSATISALLYLSYSISRYLSMAVDGMPVGGLFHASLMEITIGVANGIAFVKYKKTHKIVVSA